MYVQETYLNATEGHGIGDSDLYEPFTDDPGELFRFMRSEYGRCVGKVYVDLPARPAVPVGWVFQGRDRYQDADETYLREVWVTLHDARPEVSRHYHYHALNGSTPPAPEEVSCNA